MLADSLRDTIVAVATPAGEGAIAIVRLSGPSARRIGEAVARFSGPVPSHRLATVKVRDSDGELIDQAMKVEMHGPRSFTGEDVVELHVHGSRIGVDAVVRSCLGQGARLARAGEFSLRAFLNGRMDLSQAEALGDLINARDETQQRIANAHLKGQLSHVIRELVDALEAIMARWRVALDFPDHMEPDESEGGAGELGRCACRIQRLIDKARLDLSKGLMVVLCGAPNVGKSTLLNVLAGEERVLVDSARGTTRDPVEVEIADRGGRWTVWDTAGVHKEANGVEARGILMSLERIEQSDLALWLLAADDPTWPSVEMRVHVVGSKADLVTSLRREQIKMETEARGFEFLGWVSALLGEGVQELRKHVAGRETARHEEGEVVIVRQRHMDALQRASEALKEAAKDHKTLDVRCVEVESAAKWLGSIIGVDVDEEVLEMIFSEFCVGK